MKRLDRVKITGLFVVVALTVGMTVTSFAKTITVGEATKVVEQPVTTMERILVRGSILALEDGRITIDNVSEMGSPGEMVLLINEESTKLLDAVNGFPISTDQLQVGDYIYAYIGSMMTMSLPPQVSLELAFCQIPAGFGVPSYVQFEEVTKLEDGSIQVVANDDMTYTITNECVIEPYLTRNIVTADDIKTGGTGVVWIDYEGKPTKVMLFQLEYQTPTRPGMMLIE